MKWPHVASLLLASWLLLTVGLTLAFDSWAVPFLSAGMALAVYAYPYARAIYVSNLAEKDEADQ